MNEETIVIYRKDNKVIALDKRTDISAEATCSPEDEFNFMTGAELAFDRLKEKVTQTLKIGDIVIGNEKASKKYAYTKKGAIGEVKVILGKEINVDFIRSTLTGKPHCANYTVDINYFDLVKFGDA